MFLIIAAIISPVYSQDTTTVVQPEVSMQPVASKAKAASKWEYSVNFTGKKVSGSTEYHITYPTYIEAWYGSNLVILPSTGHSILNFPTDGIRLEASGFINYRVSKTNTIAFELAISKAITTPKEAQVDTDYNYTSALTPPQWVWSATKSDVKYSNYDLRVTTGYPFRLNPQLKMTTIVGFQTSHNSYDVIGFSGWQEYYYGIPYPVDTSGVTVAKYKVDYHQLITGLILETVPNNGLSLYLKGYYLPYVKAKDFDDHVLRNKNLSTNATGSGYQIEARIKIQAHKFVSGAVISFGGGYELIRIKATGSQIQKWYGDDPASGGFDDTGRVSSPIDNTLKLRQNNIIAFIEYKL
jgi:hypothetical protein